MTFETIPTGWRLSLDKMEGFLLAGSLNQLREDYRQDPGDLQKRRRGIYRRLVSRNRDEARSLREEQELLNEAEVLWRGERAAVLEGWLESYEPGEEWIIELNEDDLEHFLTILNDRRLNLAGQHNFSAEEMDAPPEEMPDEAIRSVLWEIHFLAMFQEALLRLLDE